MKRSFLPLLSLLVFSADWAAAAEAPPSRPNILWLVCEDSSVNWFGCYGNPEAKTPHIDALAKQGFRYTHVYACAPVCAPSRSTWITGINALSMGTQAMRSRYMIPHGILKYYPDYLRAAGYYAANRPKTDYNIGGRPDSECWDSNTQAAWTKRQPGQPFFQVLNFNDSHESKAHGEVTNTRHSPNEVTLAKYHPDETPIRMNYAKYHDAVETMDGEVGKALAALEQAGLVEDTIVIFNSDHGGVLPRSKRFLFDSGIHVPLIVRIPEKFKHLWPDAQPGGTVDRLVSFLDLPKTWLSIAGSEVPGTMQGHVFFGPKAEPEPEFAFSFRERMDERFDSQRSVRNKRFVYIKNYMPYVAWGQHLDYLWKMVATQTWEDAHKNHRTTAVTGEFFNTKPLEELYDMELDPDNVVNLAGMPEHKKMLETMRAALRSWQLEIHDTGLLPESERERRAAALKTTVYEMVRDPKQYDLAAYLEAADVALAGQPAKKDRLLGLVKSPDSGLRYWGTVGLCLLGKLDATSLDLMEGSLHDECSEVRVMAAWTLAKAGRAVKAQEMLLSVLDKHLPATLLALNVLDWAQLELTPYQGTLDALSKKTQMPDPYEQRMLEYLMESRGLKSPANSGSRKNEDF